MQQNGPTSLVSSLTRLKTGSLQKEHMKVLTKCFDGMTGSLLAIASLACSLPTIHIECHELVKMGKCNFKPSSLRTLSAIKRELWFENPSRMQTAVISSKAFSNCLVTS